MDVLCNRLARRARRSRWVACLAVAALVAPSCASAAGEWDGYDDPEEACKARVTQGGAYVYARTEVHGDVAWCFTKPADGQGSEVHDASIKRADAPEAPQVVEEPPAPAAPPVDDPGICEELARTLEATISGDDPEVSGTRAEGATFALGTIVGGDGSRRDVAAASSIIGVDGETIVSDTGRVRGDKYGNYAEGIRQGSASNVTECGSNNRYQYPANPARPYEGHAEAKIIEDWFQNNPAGSTLFLVIGGKQTEPCDRSCSRLIAFVNNGGGQDCPRIVMCK